MLWHWRNTISETVNVLVVAVPELPGYLGSNMKYEAIVWSIIIGTIVLLAVMNRAVGHNPMVIWMLVVVLISCIALTIVFVLAYKENKRK